MTKKTIDNPYGSPMIAILIHKRNSLQKRILDFKKRILVLDGQIHELEGNENDTTR